MTVQALNCPYRPRWGPFVAISHRLSRRSRRGQSAAGKGAKAQKIGLKEQASALVQRISDSAS